MLEKLTVIERGGATLEALVRMKDLQNQQLIAQHLEKKTSSLEQPLVEKTSMPSSNSITAAITKVAQASSCNVRRPWLNGKEKGGCTWKERPAAGPVKKMLHNLSLVEEEEAVSKELECGSREESTEVWNPAVVFSVGMKKEKGTTASEEDAKCSNVLPCCNGFQFNLQFDCIYRELPGATLSSASSSGKKNQDYRIQKEEEEEDSDDSMS
ncbi:hypothetical protein LR48_Vigan263s001000 [Vigna angularis]|uniref:Uncharacterized protein n=1 Tax=Phaseolus angularis TaxID=3914 RepID=A0A0L9T727_PHAAN|nr:hypothetical protein LR48_Vigan263s001000 [Vigna angularis]